MLVIFVMAAGLTAMASGHTVPALLGDPEGWSIVLIAPAGGLVAGLLTGFLAGFRRLGAFGFGAALGGFAVGMLVGLFSWPGSTGMGPWQHALAFLLLLTGIPAALGFAVGFAVGFGVGGGRVSAGSVADAVIEFLRPSWG
jgi:hypothetical protein